MVDFYYREKLNERNIDKILNELNYKFEFNKDYSEFYYKFEKDKPIGKVIQRFKGMKNFCVENLYEYLMIAILLQNTHVKRTVQMTNTMLERYEI